MDPNETLNLCIEALGQKDYEAAFYHTQDLLIWLNKGGFVRDRLLGVPRNKMEAWCQVTMAICKNSTWEKNDG